MRKSLYVVSAILISAVFSCSGHLASNQSKETVSQPVEDPVSGTGNALHPKIAVVIANKLLYVVDNASCIKTGVMCVGLVGYSAAEMTAMKEAVDQKR